ncbi:transposase [Photobacterium chitinilyticum]|uniref:transposase n=1 Tax=Photobacterium chitinilyticum TaxID=2485123 RepID=UPI003D0A420B
MMFTEEKTKADIRSNQKALGCYFHELAQRKGVTIEEGHLMKDHVHMCISVPPSIQFQISLVT